jgi:2-C-methyl-D-erythritol 4-phosphate cytidylyltransferase
MIEWSIDAFAACEAVAAIVIAVPPPGSSGSSSRFPDIRQVGLGDGSTIVVEGGGTRAESVANALAEVRTELVAIHDAARPLITPGLVEALIAALEANPEAAGAIPANPITDTVKRATSADRSNPTFSSDLTGKVGLTIETTLDRSALWAAQTPQVFRTEALREAITAAPARLDAATDESMLIEGGGGTVLIHPTGPENLKVTTPLDLRVAELLLSER